MTNTIYTEVSGTTCYISGERGTVTGLHRSHGKTVGAFVKLDNSKTMLYVILGSTVGDRGQSHEVESARAISQNEFDRITGLDVARKEIGWAA